MEIWDVLLDVVALLGAGLLLGAICERLGQSAIVGYLLTGALFGPNALQWFESNEGVSALAELGVALLLFAIGLEFSWTRLRHMGKSAIFGGVGQVLVTGVIAALAASVFGLPLRGAITLGAIVAMSSTAGVLRALVSRGEMESLHGAQSMGVLLVQDIAVVPLVLIVSVLSSGGDGGDVFVGLLKASGTGLLLIIGLYVVFNFGAPLLLRSRPMHTNRELPVLLAVVSGLGSAILCHLAGVSPALGAFVAGILLANSPFAVQVQADVSALKTLLMTLFFTTVGMLADPLWILQNPMLVFGTTVAVLVGKALVTWGVLRIFGVVSKVGLASGIALAQIGEFSFVLAEGARGSVLPERVFLLVVSTSVLTMLLTPYLVGEARPLAARILGEGGRSFPRRKRISEPEERAAIIIGFGPAGRALAERVHESGRALVIIDFNPRSRQDARKLGYRFITGDARYGDVLEHAGIKTAEFVLITTPGPSSAVQIVRLARSMAPQVLIYARSRFHRYRNDIENAGAHLVFDEELDVGTRIADAVDAVPGLRPTPPVDAARSDTAKEA